MVKICAGFKSVGKIFLGQTKWDCFSFFFFFSMKRNIRELVEITSTIDGKPFLLRRVSERAQVKLYFRLSIKATTV